MSRRPRTRKQARRGVVLLIVLSLIILFTLVAVTYAIVAGQYKMHNRAFAKVQQVGDPPRKDLDMAMYVLLRDTTVNSSLNSHSLLRDLYGVDFFRGRVTAVSAVAGGQFIEMTVALVSGSASVQSGHYNGCVFTFVTGAQRGHSTRVVGYDHASSTLRVETQDNDGLNVAIPAVGDEFVVNGRPFNGTGFGYQPPTVNSDVPGLNATVQIPLPSAGSPTNVPVAFLPHFHGYTTASAVQVDVGGADESYDAVDAQNMHLAMVPPTAMASNELIPSFHRPDLFAFWIKWLQANVLTSQSLPEAQLIVGYPYGLDNVPGTADDSVAPWSSVPLAIRRGIVDLKRRVFFRPLPEDHPNFTGSNPRYTALGGAVFGSLDCNGDGQVDMWDIDNDGDGVPDSVWIDPGFPVATGKDGRPYKKLIAVLIRDMDGRININAASALAHLNTSYSDDIQPDVRVPGLTSARPMSRGVGVGPADIDFSHLFGTLNAAEYGTLLRGRYGADQQPGYQNTDDTMSALKSLGIPNNYSAAPDAFGSPPDLSGQGVIALDHHGQPIFASMGNNGETTDDPYETDPLRNRPEDAMYTPSELERVLRANDADVAQLPQRLVQNAPNMLGNAEHRKMVTTLSSHIPVGNVHLPRELRTHSNSTIFNYLRALQNSAGAGPSLLDIYRVRLTIGGLGSGGLNREMQKIVPFEILHGQKFDINRWLGNGRDDNGNGVIDEYEEAVAGEVIWPNTAPTQFQGVNFSYYNDSTAGTDPRQIFARHLYCLAMLLMDSGYIDPFPTQAGLSPAQQREFTTRRLAQWAINAVEYRDRDAIMTPFEYDINPWNGWCCDGDLRTNEAVGGFMTSNNVDDDGDGMTDEADENGLGTDRRFVWGAEFPDLLITESFAMHNRGVRDTDYDPAQHFAIENMMRRDDMDQFRQPQGSLFVELYCPRTTLYNGTYNNAALPFELYDPNSGSLDLGRMSPARTFGMAQGRQPVWRVVITRSPNNGMQAQALSQPVTINFEPDPAAGTDNEKIIWFAPLNPVNVPESNMIYYGRTGAFIAAGAPNQQVRSNVFLPPSRYAVVGPRATTVPSALYNGADSNPRTYEPGTDNISIGAGTFSISGYPAGYPVAANNMGATIQPPVGIICAANPPQNWTNQNRQIGINVSEPLPSSAHYYPEPNPSNDGRVPADAYINPALAFHAANNSLLPPLDSPLDSGNNASEVHRRGLLGGSVRTRTIHHHRTLFLQRLANPLAPWNPDPLDPQYGATYYDANLLINPYITIDWASSDLTVYNGEDRNIEEQVMQGMNLVMEWRDQDDTDPFAGAPPDEQFATRERGSRAAAGAVDRNFWPPLSTGPRATNRVMPDRCFDYDLRHTLGFINWTASDNPAVPAAGYEGAPDTTVAQPFPWLAWNNRPFANPYELMLVPASSPQRLCWEFGIAQSGNRIYDATNGLPNDPARDPFSYLLNFFMTSPTNTAGEAPHYYRIFDYVDTPSRFAGAEKWYNPATFANTSLTEPATFRPPYNRLSRFREPGRMNINTIFDFREWRAIANGFPGYDNTGFFDELVESRRGYPAAAGTYGDQPSIFANAFRASVTADLGTNVSGFPDQRKTGVEVGLLRPAPGTNVAAATRPLFAMASGQAYEHTERNPYFAYRGINRLSNLVSYHSNVHAMWITVGYFYVDQVTPDPVVYPDGWQLGQEVGADTGSVERHRGFYLIDRSIPVAFEPGQNHNVDRAVLIRRFIE